MKKNKGKYISVKELSFSILSNMAYYSDAGNLSERIKNKLGWNDKNSPLFRLENGESFFAKRIRYLGDKEDDIGKKDECIRSRYKKMILNPPRDVNILWPKDIVEVSETILQELSLLVANDYQVFNRDVEVDKSIYALLFSENNAVLQGIQLNLRDYLEKLKMQMGPYKINYNNKLIISIAFSLLREIQKLNDNGYIYADIDLSRFFVTGDVSIVLDFSNQMYTIDEVNSSEHEVFIEEPGEYSLEFADPAFLNGDVKMIGLRSQNFSITCMLFKLLFGVYPYEGVLFDYLDDSTRMSRYNKHQQILSEAIFIFDDNDNRNHLGNTKYNDFCTNLWNECPVEIKEMFGKTLNTKNAKRQNNAREYYCPTILDWIAVFAKYNWLV